MISTIFFQVDNVDETLHVTLEANLENGVNKRLKPVESEADCRIGNNLEGNHMEGNHHESQDEQNDHFHQEEMSEGSEVVFNIIISLLLIVINMMMMMMMMVVVRWAREKEVL